MTTTDFAPRFGVNYQPPWLPNTTVRTGYGIYYTTQQAVNLQYAVVSQIITVNNAVSNVEPNPMYVLGQNALPPVTVGQITQPEANAITGPIQYLSSTTRSPYVQQWHLDIPHTFASKSRTISRLTGTRSTARRRVRTSVKMPTTRTTASTPTCRRWAA